MEKQDLPTDWEIKNNKKLYKKFEFNDFEEAMEFVNNVAKIAEDLNHHPDIKISYNEVELSIITHSEDKLTDKDYELAKKYMKKHLNIKIHGRVQGVFYRATTQEKAQEIGIEGFVRNEADGTVYVEAEGTEEELNDFLSYLEEGPDSANVTKIDKEKDELKNYKDFKIKY